MTSPARALAAATGIAIIFAALRAALAIEKAMQRLVRKVAP